MSWVIRVEEQLPLVDFAYDNSYQASIRMAPCEALYGRPCRSPLGWTEVGESSITGPDLIRDPRNSNFWNKGKIVISITKL